MTIKDFLRAHGVADEEIAAAEKGGPTALRILAIDRFLLPGEARYTAPEIAKKAGVPEDVAKRYWRALGFVDVPDDEQAFTDVDLVALKGALALVEEGYARPEVALQFARVMGQALARVAEAQASSMRARVIDTLAQAGGADEERVIETLLAESSTLVPINEAFLSYVYRRHLAAASKRLILGDGENGRVINVGFADLVGYTRLSRKVDEEELAELIDRFETNSYDVIASNGGRLVKMIGDEVMFVTEHPKDAAEIALAIAEHHANDLRLPDVRVGLARGPAISRQGDFLGETVNLANRITAAALPRKILMDEHMGEALEGDPAFVVRRITPRHLKGIGRTRVWTLNRAGQVSPAPRRWASPPLLDPSPPPYPPRERGRIRDKDEPRPE